MNILKEWRYKNNISLQRVAKMIGVSYTNVWKYDNNKPLSEKMDFYITYKLKKIIGEYNEQPKI